MDWLETVFVGITSAYRISEDGIKEVSVKDLVFVKNDIQQYLLDLRMVKGIISWIIMVYCVKLG